MEDRRKFFISVSNYRINKHYSCFSFVIFTQNYMPPFFFLGAVVWKRFPSLGLSLIMGRLFDFFVRSRKVIIVIWVQRRCGGCSTVAVLAWKSPRATVWGIDVRNRSLSLRARKKKKKRNRAKIFYSNDYHCYLAKKLIAFPSSIRKNFAVPRQVLRFN